MKKKNKDIICACGHEKKYHKSVGAPIWDEYCNGARIKSKVDKGYLYICICHEYIPDNLLHIETLDKKRKLL